MSHASPLDALEHGALPHDLGWREVLEAFRAVGAVVDHGHGKLAPALNGHRLIVHPGSAQEVPTADAAELRRFLRVARPAPQAAAADEKPWVLTIDHREAHLHRSGGDGGETHLAPDDPHGFRRHLIHRKEANYEGQRVPEDKAYYEAVCEAVRHAPALVIVSDGTGKSSAGRLFAEHVAAHHRDLRRLVTDVREVNLSAMRPADIAAAAAPRPAGEPER